jgi:glycosyltransferase involved in cell wall biosynthesis
MRISVVIPCRNGAATLGQTLQTVLGQTLPAEEVLVVDDGSDDGSVRLAEGFGAPVQVLAAAARGANAARCEGARHARGEALMFLDADDLLGPNVLAELAALLARRPWGIAACAWRRWEYSGQDSLGWQARPASCRARGAFEDAVCAWLRGWHHPPCAVLWSRTAYAVSGGWDPALPVNQDGSLMLRALLAGLPLQVTERALAYYRRPAPGRASLSTQPETRERWRARLHILLGLERETLGLSPGRRRALAQACEALAAQAARYPDVSRQAREAATRLGGPGWLRPLWAQGAALDQHCGRVWRRLRAWTRRPAAPSLPTAATPAGTPARATPDGAPLVSVIVPTYNRAAVLGRAIESVLAQTMRDLELLVVDDASSDETQALLARCGDPRLRVLRQAQNGGVARARNAGAAAARGRFLAFLDSDDCWAPEKLARQLAVFAVGPPGLGLVFTGIESHDAQGAREQARPEPSARGFVFPAMLRRNVVLGGGSNALLRRECFEIAGGFDPRLPACEDYDLWLRVSRFFLVDFLPEPLARYDDPRGAEAAARRSRNLEANHAARVQLHAAHGHDMRAAGVEQAFLIESLRRLHAGGAEPGRVLQTAAQALAANPLHPPAYAWLVLSLWPRRPAQRLRAAWRRLALRPTAAPAAAEPGRL